MVSGRAFLALLGLTAAVSAEAATVAPARLPLNLHALEGTAEVVYHPRRWLAIRRSAAYVRAEPYDDMVRDRGTSARRPRSYAMTGDVHPFGDAFRVSLGLREDDNGRLLRVTDDGGDIGTARYAPLMAVGFAGRVAEGLVLGGDLGLVGRAMNRPDDSLLVTPLDLSSRERGRADGYRPVLQLSAGYRF